MWSATVCLMCLKTFNSENCEEKDFKLRRTCPLPISSSRFALFCERFLKLPESLISKLCTNGNGSEPTANNFCLECRQVQRSTLQLYLELCEVKLKLAWRLRQWERLLKNGTSQVESGSSNKLNSLLHQQLSQQLQLDMDTKDVARSSSKEEVRKIRNLLLTHCKDARDQMVTRKLKVSLDRCLNPVPQQGDHLETMNVGFNNDHFTLTKGQNDGDLVTVKMEKEVGDEFQDVFEAIDHDYLDDHDHDQDIDWEMKMERIENEDKHNDDDNGNDIQAKVIPAAVTKKGGKRSTASTSKTSSSMRRYTKRRKCHLKKKKPKKPAPDLKETSVVKRKVSKRRARPDWIPCDVCGIAKPTPRSLFDHYRHHERHWRKQNPGKRQPFHCHFCSKSWSTDQCRRLHIECQVHNQFITTKKFSCYEEVCRGSPPFASFKDLEAHFESVHAPGSNQVFKCSLCSWPFLNDSLRHTHELTHVTHHSGVKIKCPKCDHAEYMIFSALQTHFILEHTDLKDPKINGCHKCATRYTCPWNLHLHLQTHDMEEDLEAGSSNSYHVCEQCGKQFPTNTHLYRHVRASHVQSLCNLCGEMVQTTNMQYHKQKVHKIGLSKDHACPICKKQCFKKHIMERHMRDVHHHGNDTDIEESCHICSKKYQRRGLLHRHLRIAHQIEAEELKRPPRFVCTECGMGYYYKNSLDQHVDTKHRSSEERKHNYPCTLCSKTFCRKCLLSKHFEEAHPESAQLKMDAT